MACEWLVPAWQADMGKLCTFFKFSEKFAGPGNQLTCLPLPADLTCEELRQQVAETRESEEHHAHALGMEQRVKAWAD